jgi:hypothetical protein
VLRAGITPDFPLGIKPHILLYSQGKPHPFWEEEEGVTNEQHSSHSGIR